MDISGIITWVTANWGQIIEFWLKIVGIASIVVRFTPTLKDDDVLKGVVRFVGKYLALNTNKGSSSPNA